MDDEEREDAETFSVEISEPTGGAVIGPRNVATFSIAANDLTQSGQGGGNGSGGNGGGGAAGLVSLLLLGLAEAVRAARRRIRKPERGAP